MFNKQGFGSTPSTSTFGGFGAQPAATGVTPFGQNSFNKPATAPTGFQSAGFGNAGGSSLFGATPASTSAGLFGGTSTPAFGQQQQQQQQQQQATAFSGFNAAGSTPLFGASSGGGFAQPKPAFGGFGTSTQSTGLFGAQPAPVTAASSASMFSGQTSGLFGSSPGGFGNTVVNNNNVAGTPIKFNPLAGTDTMVKNNQTTTISTRHQCITCMKEYENKSLEELRLEDLQAGRKGPQPGGGMFGASGQPAQPSLFGGSTMGQTAATGFGENKSLFGATPTSSAGLGGFGATAPPFGATSQASGGLFGKTTAFGSSAPVSSASTGFSFASNTANNNANPFGGAAAPKTFGAGTMFGAQQPTSLFGATPTTNTGFGGFGAQQQQQQPQQQGIGLFNQKPAATPFGMAQPQPAVQTGFGFNQTPAVNTQSGGLFGNKPALGTGLSAGFGATTTSPFGAKPLGTAAPSFGSSFGAQQPIATLGGGASLFGQNPMNKPATAPTSFGFGAAQPTTSFGTGLTAGNNLFGNKPAAPTSLFGATAAPGGLFNNTSTATTGLFNNTFGAGTGGLSLTQAPNLGLTANKGFGGFQNPLGAQTMLGAPQGQSAHQNIMNLVQYPYGDQPLFRNLSSEKVEELRMKATNPAAQKAALAQSSPAFTLSSSASPRLSVKPPSATPAKTSLFDGLDSSSSSALGASPYKNLAAAITPKSSIKLLKLRPDANSSSGNITVAHTPEKSQQPPTTPSWAASSKFRDILPGGTPTSSTPKASSVIDKETLNERAGDLDSSLADVRSARKLALDESRSPLDATDASICLSDISEVPEDDTQAEPAAPHPAGIVLTRGGYYTVPSMEQLAKLYEETQSCEVDNFTVGRLNYGNIYFDESMDVAGLNLDEIVHIRHREVVVYPNDEEKPLLGKGLNRKAQVTLDRIYPTNKQTRAPIKDVDTIINMDYDTTLRKACYKMKARFVEYIPDTGSWVFKVEHFSKYGLPDDSDDDEDITVSDVSKARPPAQVPVPPKPPVIVAAQQPKVPVKPHTLSDTHSTVNMSMPFTNMESMDEDFCEILSPSDQLPHLTRIDTSKIRLMKASLFEMEAIADDEKMVEDEFTFEKPMTPTLPHDLTVMRDVDHETTLAVPEQEARPNRPHQRPTIVTPKFMPFPSLLPQGLDNYLADSALYQGHCAKSSWTVNGAVISTTNHRISVECPYLESDIKKENLEKHMSIQLNLTCFDAEDGPVPRLYPREGQDLLVAHCELVKTQSHRSHKERMVKQVLMLCHTLWGELPASSTENTPAIVSCARRKAVCDWLQTCIWEEENADPTPVTCPEEMVMKQLSQGKLQECIADCQKVGDHYLSLVVASSGSAIPAKTMFQRQVHDWVTIGVSKYINEDRLRAFLLCGAGQPMLTQEDAQTLNALQGLDWLSALAVHAWYLCSPAASVPDLLAKYETAFLESPNFAAAPIPPGGTEVYLDVRYQLLKLFSQRTYPLESLLSVETHFPESKLDFSLSWMLLVVLDSLHYTHVSEHCSQNLHLIFAEQLEAVKLWHWSIFVLLHITNPAMRASAVEQVITRHARPNEGSPKTLSQKEEFVVNKLGVPAKMIYSAKAMHTSNRYLELAYYHFYAEEWDQCYQTLITHLTADAIINDDYKVLWELLRELQRHSHEIDGWHERGQVYCSYLSLREDLEALKYQSAEDKLEAITQKVVLVCNQLRHMPCDNPKERLGQSEMAFKLFELARSLILANRNQNKSVSEDYRLRELDNVMRFVYRNNDPPQSSK